MIIDNQIESSMSIREFFNTEFKEFSNLDNVRSIPSLIDGLKDSQRKAVYGMMLHKGGEIKVAQGSGAFALKTHYAHGENSMAETIVGLAQNFPGSNNVNLFEPIGQFGSILSPQSASHRYIYTKPSTNLRKYIPAEDDGILEHRYEDNDKVEPLYFLPIVPFWILNGSIGVGTGHAVKILPRSPKDCIKAIKMIVKGKPEADVMKLLTPSYTGWNGTITNNEGQYSIKGIIEKVNTTTLKVTSLPPQYSVDKFKTILVGLMDSNKVKDYDNNSTEESFEFIISVPREIGRYEIDKLEHMFKMSVRVTENITLWGVDGNLKRYENAYQALKEFVDFRLIKYQERKDYLLNEMGRTIDTYTNKMVFIKNWLSLDNVGKMTQAEIKTYQLKNGVKEEFFDSFMMMRLTSLTKEMVESLLDDIKKLEKKKVELEAKSNTDLYYDNLKEI